MHPGTMERIRTIIPGLERTRTTLEEFLLAKALHDLFPMEFDAIDEAVSDIDRAVVALRRLEQGNPTASGVAVPHTNLLDIVSSLSYYNTKSLGWIVCLQYRTAAEPQKGSM